jgi:hypothetical protein
MDLQILLAALMPGNSGQYFSRVYPIYLSFLPGKMYQPYFLPVAQKQRDKY